MATAYNEYGDENAALKHYKEALNINIDNSELMVNIAQILEKQETFQEAYNLYRKALITNPACTIGESGMKRLSTNPLVKIDKNDPAFQKF